MRIALRWMFRLLLAGMVTALAGVMVLYYVLAGSLPDYDEDFTVTGVSAPVEILRNSAAIPHIFGQTEADIFYALGFAHAQDRLWQIDDAPHRPRSAERDFWSLYRQDRRIDPQAGYLRGGARLF